MFLRHVRRDRFYALYLLAATTGMRRAELCGLRWVDVDLDAGQLAIEDTRVVVDGHAEGGSDGKTSSGSGSSAWPVSAACRASACTTSGTATRLPP